MGRTNMDEALTRNTIVPQVRELMQTILDRYNVGVEIVEINLQQGGVRPPEQVQAAFDDVNKAGQERERAKNEAEAYANDVIPRAVGSASRLQQEADAYKARVVAQAQGDAQRFRSVLAEYQKAPQVTRDRMYLDAMQQIYTNVTKVLVESRQGSSLLYLPLEKILQAGASPQGEALGTAVPGSTVIPAQPAAAGTVDARSRDAARTRERETR
jgi:membrane protease subunit HflK